MSGAGFFDFQQRIPRRPPTGEPASAPTDARPLTVTQLTAKIERALKSGLPATLLVKGEISNYKAHGSSGHSYFTMKDASACIDCVMFRSDAARLRFEPRDGMELLAVGRVAVYAQRGRYQLYATSLQPIGQDALELAFQQLRAKLETEGLFAAERKRPLPLYPARIVLVTSSATAALQDVLKVLRRFPWLRLFLYHVPVQGDGAAAEIAAAITYLGARHADVGTIDAILLTRGGGSLEDLWAFNDEMVARALVASPIPIITGIGHEVDTSIADLVADYHAHTPTEAAQVLVQHWKTVKDAIESGGIRLRRSLRASIATARQRLLAIERHECFRRPLHRVNQLRQLLDDRQRALSLTLADRLRNEQYRLADYRERLDAHHPRAIVARHRHQLAEAERALANAAHYRLFALRDRLQRAIVLMGDRHPKHQMRLMHERLTQVQARLNSLSPENVLRRGYTISTVKRTGVVVRSVNQLKPGDRILTRLPDGTAESTVEDGRQLPLFE